LSIKVHLLVTALNGRLNEASVLVFRTLRIGFPTLPVTVWGNRLNRDAEEKVFALAAQSGACWLPMAQELGHDQWIAKLILESPSPFWLCDGDMIFRDNVEGFARGFLAGRYEPAFHEPWSGTQKVARLHRSLLYVDAPALRGLFREWMGKWHPKGFPFLPETEFVKQHYVPCGAGLSPLFYDTMAGAFQAFGGESFTQVENSAFTHLHCGSYVHRMGDAIPGLAKAHDDVISDAGKALLMDSEQDRFYAMTEVTYA